MFDLPDVVDPEVVDQFDLLEGLPVEPSLVGLLPRPWEPVFVEDAELHAYNLVEEPQQPTAFDRRLHFTHPRAPQASNYQLRFVS